jgi:methylmalonyl-CoA mutase N-terminal domain/subunit
VSGKEYSEEKKKWEKALASPKCKEQRDRFETISFREVKPLYLPEHIGHPVPEDYRERLGFPGSHPYTRGVHPTMYRGRTWTMRQFSGFGTAADTNERYKYILSQGGTGLSVAFDMPTIMGYDSDHPRSEGEVGRCGVAISSLADMETLFDGIPLDKVSTSMTINGPASILWAFYIAVGEKQGVSPDKLRGTIQNDILKEYIAQKSWIFPPRQSMRIITDILAYAAGHVPQWNTISISGYHIREAGSTAAQELAFTLADGLAYVEAGIEAGLDVDVFAPRLAFFFDAHSDFFEEIAKYRAARRIWARRMKSKYGAKDPRSWTLRFHTQTAGCSLTAQQPENNIIRTAYQALSAVLGGTQSLHTNSMDETLALPTEKATKIALRTQQIIEDETGAASTIDPLGGSYFIEKLTDEMEEAAEEYFRRIDELGGVIPAIEQGFFQREIADAAYRFQRALESGDRVMVGINKYFEPDEKITIDLLKIDPRVDDECRANLKKLRESRDNAKVKEALSALKKAAEGSENLMPRLLEAVRRYATLGEIVETLKSVFGEYVETPIF